MLRLRIKNLIRIVIGYLSPLSPMGSRGLRIYCNLMEGKVYGGPNRFLKNITSSKTLRNNVTITNWSLKHCTSALVFSASWGKSFSRLCKLLGVHTVLRVDGFYVPDDIVDEQFQQSLKFRQWVNRRLAEDLERFDHIIYQSEFSKRICDQYLHKRTNEFTIIPNGTNLNHFAARKITKSETIRLIVLGKHYPKHLNLALDILSRVLKVQNAELHIVGPMRNGADEVQKHFDDLAIPDEIKKQIRCHGIVSLANLPQLLQSADVLLHVKVGDWCPNAVIEALACGLPVVCPMWGGTAELIGSAGLAVEGPKWGVSDELAHGMADAVLKVHRDLERYSKAARELAEERFDIEMTSKKYLQILFPNTSLTLGTNP